MAWRKILALGLLASAAFAGCTVTTDDPDDDDEDGGSGGSSTGGKASTGGKSSTGGSASTGGKSSTGGTDSGPTTCGAGDNACSTCVQDKCCQEWLDCGDDENCSYKSDAEPGELLCIQDCLLGQLAEAGAADLLECDSICAEGSAGSSAATSDLIACIRAEGDSTDGGVALQNCSTPCFGVEL